MMIVLASALALAASNTAIQKEAVESVRKPLIAVEAEEDAAALLEEADELELDEIVFDDEVSELDETSDEE